MTWRLYRGDCLDMLAELDDASVDACVCDPPYGLGKPPPIEKVLAAWLAGERVEVKGGGFMGAEWDAFVPGPRYWREVARVLKPGGHAVVFAGQRTIDVMGIALRLAGLEVRDLLGWQYWSGFPKSLNGPWGGTALKPCIEPALLVRKPLSGTVAGNVLAHGTGALNIDGCRYAFGDPAWPGPGETFFLPDREVGQTGKGSGCGAGVTGLRGGARPASSVLGRWPANVYACPKASTAERERGCDALPLWSAGELVQREEGSAGMNNPRAGAGRTSHGRRNAHPTVKPVRLLRWIVRLVTPPQGTVIDPFAGSGSCGVAATLEGFAYIGAELGERYQPIAEARIAHAVAHPEQWLDTRPGPKVTDDEQERADIEAAGQGDLFGGTA